MKIIVCFHFLLVLRTEMTTPNHASLTYQDGLTAAAGVAFGVSSHYACLDFFAPCFDIIVTPTSDPLYFFPPLSYFLSFWDMYDDLTAKYIAQNFSTVLNNTIVVVIGMNIENVNALPSPYLHDNVVWKKESFLENNTFNYTS